MAAINSLTYLVYSILTLAANNKPTTDPSLNAWEIGSESQVTEPWNQEPHYVTGKYNEESCPAGETWSDCDAGCQTTCENVGKPVICPRMCIPGCVCEDPGTVRGPDKKCIHPPLCPKSDEPPVTPYDIPVTLNGEWEPNRHYENKKHNEESCPAGETWSECDAGCQTTCENVGKPVICPRMCIPGCVCEDPGTVRGPDKKCIHPPLCPKSDVDPDDPDRAEQDPNRGKFDSGGCPNSSACSRSCKRQGYKWGLCTGPGKITCHCYRHM